MFVTPMISENFSDQLVQLAVHRLPVMDIDDLASFLEHVVRLVAVENRRAVIRDRQRRAQPIFAISRS